MDQPLHIESPLQRHFDFGIEILASPIGATPSPQGGIVRLVVVGMDCRRGTNSGKRMVDFDPFHPRLALGPFDFHRHFQPFPPDLAIGIAHRQSSVRQVLTGQRP